MESHVVFWPDASSYSKPNAARDLVENFTRRDLEMLFRAQGLELGVTGSIWPEHHVRLHDTTLVAGSFSAVVLGDAI